MVPTRACVTLSLRGELLTIRPGQASSAYFCVHSYQMGIANYNAECRAIVMRYSSEWEKTIKRVGRWIDFKNDYKTMHLSYMESVWWVFKELHEKGLVYRGFKARIFLFV